MRYPLASVLALTCIMTIGGNAPAFAAGSPQVPPMPAAPLPAAAAQTPSKDQFAPLMNQAMEAYQAGKLKESLKLINQAQDIVRTKHAALYRPLLPPAPGGGWTVDDATDASASLGGQMMGGMSVVGRSYKANGHTAQIAYVVDAPMMALAAGVMQAVTLSGGAMGSSEEVKGNKALYQEKTDSQKGPMHVLIVFAGDVTVMVQSPTLPKDTLMQFASIVDYDKLKIVQ